MGEEMAKKYGMIYMEASAKTGDNVNELFDSITEKIIEQRLPNLEQDIINQRETVVLQ